MMRTTATLAAIFIAVTAAVHFGYKQLEKELQQMSCVPQSAGQRGTAAAEPVSPAAGPQPVAEPLPARGKDFQIIVRRDIFQAGGGAAAAVQKPPEPVLEPEAVPTRLNLTLAGTVTGSPKSARAIVVDNATGNRQQLLLRVGDGVQGAVIRSIDWNKITLEVNGRLEELEMPKPNEKSFSRSSAFSRSAGFSPPPVQEQADTVNQGGPPTRPERRISLPEELEQAADNAPDLPDLPELEMEPPSDELPEELRLEQPQKAELPPELLSPAEGGEMPQLPEEELLPPMQ